MPACVSSARMQAATSTGRASPRIRLRVVDRRPVFARALEALLGQAPQFEVVGAPGGDCAGEADIVIVSGVAPREGALAMVSSARRDDPKAATMLLLDAASPSFVSSAHAAGVHGMLLDDVAPDNLVAAVVAVHRGERVFDPGLAPRHREARVTLSDREIEVLKLAADGASPHAISRALNLSKSTTRTYLSAAIRKMGATNRADAARAARDLGWL
jgi:two-component system, NarL family, response regulator DesR